jgi:dienelactone hydrolase
MRTAVRIGAGQQSLAGDLALPDFAPGVVAFAHGSGSSRHSPRNRAVAGALVEAGLGTLLFDLLTEDEEATDLRTRRFRFDIPLLTDRLVAAVDWLAGEPSTAGLPVGLFGASTGAAAALMAAALRPSAVRAVVSRGGRPDLAEPLLGNVRAPTLLLVGGRDETVLDLNHRAAAMLSAPWRLDVIPGASHLFEEPGTLDDVVARATEWFREHLA